LQVQLHGDVELLLLLRLLVLCQVCFLSVGTNTSSLLRFYCGRARVVNIVFFFDFFKMFFFIK
jgi:hypothetical protein